ncbi:MAG TPA: helix-turn-helix transcriptional regulator [Candidatus Acidoferrales bacterium]|nr:helix-turn-helix transcriptional regulator [Candidatus Acidoferrales bacterium]
MRTQETHIGMFWKLRRIAAHYRQQDVSTHCGISMARYRAIEHGRSDPDDLDRRLIEKFLPPLPTNDPPASECVPAGGSVRAAGRETSAEPSP